MKKFIKIKTIKELEQCGYKYYGITNSYSNFYGNTTPQPTIVDMMFKHFGKVMKVEIDSLHRFQDSERFHWGDDTYIILKGKLVKHLYE